MGYFYILLCADGTFYVGSTRKLLGRLWEHRGLVRSTRVRDYR